MPRLTAFPRSINSCPLRRCRARFAHAGSAGRQAPPIPLATLGRQLTVEFIGTFVLVFTVGLATSTKGAGDLAPLAIGSALMVMVFAGGHISGAHYNPAVSLAALDRRQDPSTTAAGYVVTQFVAGALAALLARAMVGRASTVAVAADWKVLVAELIFTLALAYVVLNVTAARGTDGNSFYGLCDRIHHHYGRVRRRPTWAAASTSPSRSRGGIAGALVWSHWWIYLLASLLAGTSAAVVFDYLHPEQTSDG